MLDLVDSALKSMIEMLMVCPGLAEMIQGELEEPQPLVSAD